VRSSVVLLRRRAEHHRERDILKGWTSSGSADAVMFLRAVANFITYLGPELMAADCVFSSVLLIRLLY
jgi:hypothetical protein